MKPTDFKSSDKDPKFKVNGIYSRKRLKFKLARKSFKVFLIKHLKITVL